MNIDFFPKPLKTSSKSIDLYSKIDLHVTKNGRKYGSKGIEDY